MTVSRTAWRVIALATAGVLFALALRVDVYNATSPRGLSSILFGPDVVTFAHPWWLSLHIWVRKAYSVVAFAAVGFTADRALGPSRRRLLRAALLVAGYSLAIEVAQRIFVAREPNLESLLDVVCGAAGGALAIRIETAVGLWR